MCRKYYRNCERCSSDVHMNFKCSCGGDPWNMDLKRAALEDAIQSKINEHKIAILKLQLELRAAGQTGN